MLDLADHHVELGAPAGRLAHLDLPAERPQQVGQLAGGLGLPPSSSRARTILPLVALLKWLTTWRLPFDSCSTRTVATRGASSAGGRQKAAYIVDRRSTSRPSPSASVTAGPSASRQTAATGPRLGRAVSPERRYAGIRSPARTSPNSEEVTATRDPSRRLAAGERVAASRAS